MARVMMLIHEENGSFGASFPDFPGATTVADSVDALLPKAAEMLAFHVAGMAEDGEGLPLLRTASQMTADPDVRADAQGAMMWLLDVDLPGRSVRVNITLDETVLKRIDRAAAIAGESRSGFLAVAARAQMAEGSKAS